ncbi:MAG: hypothetical protein ACRYGK_06840 [Janthinobacterium lividum]
MDDAPGMHADAPRIMPRMVSRNGDSTPAQHGMVNLSTLPPEVMENIMDCMTSAGHVSLAQVSWQFEVSTRMRCAAGKFVHDLLMQKKRAPVERLSMLGAALDDFERLDGHYAKRYAFPLLRDVNQVLQVTHRKNPTPTGELMLNRTMALMYGHNAYGVPIVFYRLMWMHCEYNYSIPGHHERIFNSLSVQDRVAFLAIAHWSHSEPSEAVVKPLRPAWEKWHARMMIDKECASAYSNAICCIIPDLHARPSAKTEGVLKRYFDWTTTQPDGLVFNARMLGAYMNKLLLALPTQGSQLGLRQNFQRRISEVLDCWPALSAKDDAILRYRLLLSHEFKKTPDDVNAEWNAQGTRLRAFAEHNPLEMNGRRIALHLTRPMAFCTIHAFDIWLSLCNALPSELQTALHLDMERGILLNLDEPLQKHIITSLKRSYSNLPEHDQARLSRNVGEFVFMSSGTAIASMNVLPFAPLLAEIRHFSLENQRVALGNLAIAILHVPWTLLDSMTNALLEASRHLPPASLASVIKCILTAREWRMLSNPDDSFLSLNKAAASLPAELQADVGQLLKRCAALFRQQAAWASPGFGHHDAVGTIAGIVNRQPQIVTKPT